MLKPLLTEKTLQKAEDLNIYTFVGDRSIDKNKARLEIQNTYGVDVKSIRISIVRGKTASVMTKKGKKVVKKQSKKKILVKLPEKQKIEAFEIKEKKSKKIKNSK